MDHPSMFTHPSHKLDVDRSSIRSMTIKAFDGSKSMAIGKVGQKVFMAMDIFCTFNLLLGQPWIHLASTTFKSLKGSNSFQVTKSSL